MLPKWKQRKYILVLLFWVLSLYDVNEREVWSMALNDNIKEFREEKNLTQQQLADKLYVSRQTVCRWENGSRCPDLITAKKLALELDVSMDELISDEDVNDMQVNYGIWKSERVSDPPPEKDSRSVWSAVFGHGGTDRAACVSYDVPGRSLQ